MVKNLEPASEFKDTTKMTFSNIIVISVVDVTLTLKVEWVHEWGLLRKLKGSGQSSMIQRNMTKRESAYFHVICNTLPSLLKDNSGLGRNYEQTS